VDLSLALGAQRDAHVRAEAATQRVLDAAHFGRLPYPLLEPRAAHRRATTAHTIFHVTHRETEVHGFLGERRRGAHVLECEQGARVTDRESAVMQQCEHRYGEFEQAQGVRDGGAVASHGIGHVLLREIELRNQSLVAARFVHG